MTTQTTASQAPVEQALVEHADRDKALLRDAPVEVSEAQMTEQLDAGPGARTASARDVWPASRRGLG